MQLPISGSLILIVTLTIIILSGKINQPYVKSFMNIFHIQNIYVYYVSVYNILCVIYMFIYIYMKYIKIY